MAWFSKKNSFKSYEEVIPQLGDILQEDVMTALTDKEKFLSYTPGRNLRINIKAGDLIPKNDPLVETIRTGKIISRIVPADVYGVSFKGITYPIKNSNGEVIGAIGFAKSLENETFIGESLTELADDMKASNRSLDEIVHSINNISNKSQENTASIQETFANIEEISNSSLDITQIASEAKDISVKSIQNARTGADFVQKIVKKIDYIEKSSDLMAERINSLNESIKKIEDMVSLINQISEQTNLLALNASIEAARAGEHGRGFAVVAGEVGNLAVQTKDATIDISDTVNLVRDEINKVIKTVNQSKTDITEGVVIANDASKEMATIEKQIELVDGKVSDISNYSKQQSQHASDITNSIKQLVNSIEDTASSTHSIRHVLEEHEELLENFEHKIQTVVNKLV